MKKAVILILLAQLIFITNMNSQTTTNESQNCFYSNPIFAGDYPDPSILLDGETYYIVHSSFEYYPGLLI